MLLKARVWSAGKMMMLVFALVATYFLFAFASMRVALRAREVEIPDLRGQTLAEATAQLSGLTLALRVDPDKRLDATVPADRVLLQDPAPGATTRRQRSIRVWLSGGPRITTIPRLTGESERTAQLRIEADALSLVSVSEIRSNDYDPDTVIAQEPMPDGRGTDVSLLVNRGEEATSYVMPDLIGMPGDRVAELLRTRGFRVAVVGDQPYPGTPAGVVLRHTPQAGFRLTSSEPISIEVSR